MNFFHIKGGKRQRLWRLCLVGCLPMMFGCVESMQYFYVEITSPEFRVVETGQSRVGEISLYLAYHSDMPIRYRAEFDEYNIEARMPLTQRRTLMTFSARSDDGIALGLYGDAESDCYGTFFDTHWKLHEEVPRNAITYAWDARAFPRNQPDGTCEPKVLFIDQPLVLNFEIYDTDGAVLGRESVEVQIRKNGRLYYLDGP